METLGLAGISSLNQENTIKYNNLLKYIGHMGMLIQFERFIDEGDLSEIINQIEDNLFENNFKLPY